MSAAQFRPHQAVRILTGKLAGAVGTVLEQNGTSVRVEVSGVLAGKPVHAVAWLRPSQLEVMA